MLLTHIPPWHDPDAVLTEATPHFSGPTSLAVTGARLDDRRAPKPDAAARTRLGTMTTRADGRRPDELREVKITRGWLGQAEGSVLVEFGQTRVLVAASVTQGVPALAQGVRARLGDQRVRDAARAPRTPAPTASRSRAGSAAAPTRSAG